MTSIQYVLPFRSRYHYLKQICFPFKWMADLLGFGITNFFSITLMLYQDFVFQHEFFGADILYKLFVMAYKKDSDILFL